MGASQQALRLFCYQDLLVESLKRGFSDLIRGTRSSHPTRILFDLHHFGAVRGKLRIGKLEMEGSSRRDQHVEETLGREEEQMVQLSRADLQ